MDVVAILSRIQLYTKRCRAANNLNPTLNPVLRARAFSSSMFKPPAEGCTRLASPRKFTLLLYLLPGRESWLWEMHLPLVTPQEVTASLVEAGDGAAGSHEGSGAS